jgi:small GTP-binding protein
MAKPIIAIVGRPNVGKSTLFNKLIGERRAIVEDTPGVTRDRIYGETEWRGKHMIVIDTGGIEPKTDDHILRKMRDQAQIAIDTADVIIFMCDIRTGLLADDMDIALGFRAAAHHRKAARGTVCKLNMHRLMIHVSVALKIPYATAVRVIRTQ